jgi:TolA-binding protein
VDDAIVSARKAIDLLISQRKQVDTELEFYAKDPSKAPLKLKRQIGQNQESIEAQKRFISNQESEKQRINSRFDEELVRLKVLWAERAPPSPAKVPAAKK